eukprot:5854194-Prorocentrum_lima.AAC.1
MEYIVFPSPPVQMVSVFYDIESPMHVWDTEHQCYITSHDEELNDEVELYLPPNMAHWFNKCHRELQADE